ncbi:DUF2202 domain-containing protein [Rhodoferax sp. 4810]|uniref:DUF2202 domain-containing protein n=1 Tax=Thiospirillum jenense TaxID=1653858 RepID=A0A839HD96_9GAMM|nr:DUF2202 domain-containing protein [Thiospirillum jenense]MBB1075867.1 DUF2202 domain-containing protein [Rhodoferax jenense]MBB1126110.1 DUF2202 domain-containing protein [Thiospirillum jenense]
MPKLRLLTVALSAALLTTPAFAGNGHNGTDRGTPPTAAEMLDALPISAPLDTTESDNLLFMREEERLARDVYLQFDSVWEQAPPFAGVAQSEQQHMDVLALLLERYGLAEPSDPTLSGVYANATLQEFYNNATVTGAESLLAALRIGALIEETDIADLTAAIAATDNVDLQEVYGHLQRGSRNHLRAYVSEIERQGGDAYVAQSLTQEEVDAIVAEPMERGGPGHGGMMPPPDGMGTGTPPEGMMSGGSHRGANGN